MTTLERNALGALLWATTCTACYAKPTLVPLRLRPDTRLIGVVHVDSVAVRQTLQILYAALPNESSVCYTGELYDSTVTALDSTRRPIKVLNLATAREAIFDSASTTAVFYSRPRAGCRPDVLAIGHSHPYASAYPCTHSFADANLMFLNPRVLLSIVWCGDGRMELLYQDGRRSDFRWREP